MKRFLRRHRIACLFVVFTLLRIIFLFRFPPFTDESIYVRWGQLMIKNPLYRWASVQYFAKQPLAFWIFGLGTAITNNPFIGARLAALVINLTSFYFLYQWLKQITREKIAFISLVLFTVCPVFILFQSVALMEGLLITMMTVLLWSLSGYIKTHNIFYLIMTTLSLVASLWIKSNALILVLGTFMLLGYLIRTQPKDRIRIVWHLGVCILIGGVLLIPLLAQQGKLVAGSQEYIFTVRELLSWPVHAWVNNLIMVILSLFVYVSPVYIFALLFCRNYFSGRQVLYLLFWITWTAGVSVIMGKQFFVRYAVMSFIPLLPLVSGGLLYLMKQKKVISGLSIAGGIIVPSVLSLFLLWRAPWFFSLFPAHSVVAGERAYAYDWTSGYAVSAAVQFIQSRLEPQAPILLAVADVPGHPSDSILATFYNSQSVKTFIIDSPDDLKQAAPIFQKVPTFYIARKDTIRPFLVPYLTEVKKFPTPDGGDFVGIYALRPTL